MLTGERLPSRLVTRNAQTIASLPINFQCVTRLVCTMPNHSACGLSPRCATRSVALHSEVPFSSNFRHCPCMAKRQSREARSFDNENALVAKRCRQYAARTQTDRELRSRRASIRGAPLDDKGIDRCAIDHGLTFSFYVDFRTTAARATARLLSGFRGGPRWAPYAEHLGPERVTR